MAIERSDNLHSVQFMRGIAAFLVVLCHAIGDDKTLPATNIIRRISAHGWMGVEIFFIISGFIIPYSMFVKDYKLPDFKIFFLKRIVRIEPPYIISIALVLVLNWSTTWSSWYTGPAYQVNWPNVFGHLGYLNAFTGQPWLNLAYWTLAVEFEYYILLAILYPLITSRNKVKMFATYFVLLAITFVPFPLRTMHIPLYFPFFLLGIALFLFKCGKISVTEFVVMAASSFIVCFFVHGPLLCCVSAVTMLCIYFLKSIPKAFLLLGTISYSLYLTHNVLITRFMALSARYLKFMGIWQRLALGIGFCLVVAYLYYLAIEKPFYHLSKKIQYRHKNVKQEVLT